MKKCLLIKGVFLICLLLMMGCGAKDEKTNNEDKTKDKARIENKEVKDDEIMSSNKDENKTLDEENTDAANTENTEVLIEVYSPNEDVTGFFIESVKIDVLSPENILTKLIERGVLNSKVEIQGFKSNDVGEKRLDIDFNDEFLAQLNSTGSSNEYYIMGSICNTFLKAYHCNEICITVNGASISTGHAEYQGYLSTFE